ncbi:glycosyltransferase family 1 protein [Falsiroseomonas sp.]|uniref:glycosyltransferase family 4 protein n=1 Tax=Falsiroseomonas sp. TaxID=2870721 RepID=UPI002720ACFC|nr:glycosyltransferase family 1 protein [Falsiroseomonas sp.]MDO9499502.1 glycosyltransferase family 1 protein [Falsiroseomonas sp.]MDP3415169.1 glycosyltransferase family 1 protein [Falsiroseomonas sp.]
MPKPRIAIDGYNLALDQGTGVATYARNLSHRLGALGAEVGVLYGQRGSTGQDELLREVTLYDARPRAPSWLKRAFADAILGVKMTTYGAAAKRVPLTDRVIRQGLESRLPHADTLWNAPELFRTAVQSFGLKNRMGLVRLPERQDVMHWTYPLPLRAEGTKNIYTIHDLVPLRMPYATLDVKRRYLGTCRAIAMHADHIVTVSEASKRDIINLLGVPAEKISNTYQSVEIPDRLVRKPENLARAEVKGAFGLDWGEYWLFFGAIEPKKNVGRLIEAYLASGSTKPLVICGKQAWQMRQELGLIYEDDIRMMSEPGPIDGVQSLVRKLRDRVILLDYAPFRLLVSLIRGARAMLFPSLYEGFGLPALEAMLLGTPVMTSTTSSLPEVVGDAALTVDPYDTRAMAEAIQALDGDETLRLSLAAKGPVQAALFDGAHYEKRLTEMYARIGIALEPR